MDDDANRQDGPDLTDTPGSTADVDGQRSTRPGYAAGRQTRRAILESASRLFRERGLAGASKSEIAKEAGVFPSQLGYYFGNKEALFVEAACRDLLHLATDVESAAARARTPTTYMRALVRTALDSPTLLFFIEAVLIVRNHPELASASRGRAGGGREPREARMAASGQRRGRGARLLGGGARRGVGAVGLR